MHKSLNRGDVFPEFSVNIVGGKTLKEDWITKETYCFSIEAHGDPTAVGS